MDRKSLPDEIYLWQCPDCQRVMDLGEELSGTPGHLKPADGEWCSGVPRRFAYRLVTRSDYVLRA